MAQTDYIVSTTALSLTPSGTTVGSGNVTAASFTVCRTFTRASIGAGELASGSQTWTVHTVVSATSGLFGSQFRLQRKDSGGAVQSSSPYTTAHEPITTGTYDEPVTWDSGVWAANDQLVLSWEAYRTSGTGNKTCTLTVNGSSYVVAPVPAATLFGASVFGATGGFTSAGFDAGTGAAAQAFTATLTTQGTREVLGQSVLPLAFDATTAGSAETPPSGTEWFGATALDLTANLTTNGHQALLALASADSVDGAWTDQDGGSNLEAALDELVAVDADYIRSELNPAASACRLKLAALSDPNSSSGHILRWRIAKDAADGATVDMTMALYQGGGDVVGAGTLIASFTRLGVSEAFTSYEEALSGAQADAISDYAALYLEFEASV